MSFGQGINLKLYSGKEPWDEQFYSSTCDSMYIGGQHGGAGQTNCPYINHKDWGITSDKESTNSVKNLQKGNIDPDFFNKWFKARPSDLEQTGGHLTQLGLSDAGITDGLASIAPGTNANYWDTSGNHIGNWAQKGKPYFVKGFEGLGANGWDWALQSCRQEYGGYLNSDVKCDDPVCQMEKVAQTNPVYFESACNMDLHSSCVTDTIAKAVLVPIGEVLLTIALTAATGGIADVFLAEGIVAEGAVTAGVEAGEIATQSVAEVGLKGITEEGAAEAIEIGESQASKTAEELAEREHLNISKDLGRETEEEAVEVEEGAEESAEEAAERKEAEERVRENACENYSSGGLVRSAAVSAKRTKVMDRALHFGQEVGTKTKFLSRATIADAGRQALGLATTGALAAGIAGVSYVLDEKKIPYIMSANSLKIAEEASLDIAKIAGTAYHDYFQKTYKECTSNIPSGSTKEEAEKLQLHCKANAMDIAQKYVSQNKATVADSVQIGRDLVFAAQWKEMADVSKKLGAVYRLKKYGKLSEKVDPSKNPFKGLKGQKWGGAISQAVKCNWKSHAVDAVMIGGAGLLADSIAHEDCFTCTGNEVQEDSSTAWNPFVSGLGIQNEEPYGKSIETGKPIPAWSGDVVKPYCFIPNRRGAEGYCPIFGDTLKFENNDPNWVESNSTDYQKYKGAILGTTDYEMPNNRPFWTLNDTQSRVQTGKQGLHHIIEGDTPPDVWNLSGGLDPAFKEDSAMGSITEGGRKWTNYGYVCNYNHTDDFIMNPIQAQNFLDMTIGPIDTIDVQLSGMTSNTCARPIVFKDLQRSDSKAHPETVYSKTGCMVADKDPLPINTKPYSQWSLNDKIQYYFSNDITERVNVLGQGTSNEHYQSNIIPVPSDPNIPYNQDFTHGDGIRPGGDDPFALLPSRVPQYTGSLPWFQEGTTNYTYDKYLDTLNAVNTNYKLPATFWYEHDTFNKIMADYCIRKGPKIGHPGDKENYDNEMATSSSDNCLLPGGTASASSGLSDSSHEVRTYCPNMFLKQAGLPARGPAGMSNRDTCYNCSQAELDANHHHVPRPTDVCGRWYKGMIDSYQNLSNITKQNPTQIFSEYHKAVDEYCNVPSHRDLIECSCHNADNVNNPTEYNHYFQTWSSFENIDMGTKGMKYCWLTPCVPSKGGFSGFEGENIINFKDPAAYVNSFRQTPDSPWTGKCPDMACEEFLIYTDNTKLTDDHINTGIHACGGDTLSNQGYICGTDNQGNPECKPSGRYISNTDPEYSQTKETCLKKCLAKGPGSPPCIEQYYICKDGTLQKTYNKEYSQFWSGHNTAPGSDACEKIKPHNAPPGNTSAIIDVSNESDFIYESERCEKEPYVPYKDTDQEETYKEVLLIIIVVMTSLLMMVLTYFFMIKPYLHKKFSLGGSPEKRYI